MCVAHVESTAIILWAPVLIRLSSWRTLVNVSRKHKVTGVMALLPVSSDTVDYMRYLPAAGPFPGQDPRPSPYLVYSDPLSCKLEIEHYLRLFCAVCRHAVGKIPEVKVATRVPTIIKLAISPVRFRVIVPSGRTVRLTSLHHTRRRPPHKM
jgi:hypothetical protein